MRPRLFGYQWQAVGMYIGFRCQNDPWYGSKPTRNQAGIRQAADADGYVDVLFNEVREGASKEQFNLQSGGPVLHLAEDRCNEFHTEINWRGDAQLAGRPVDRARDPCFERGLLFDQGPHAIVILCARLGRC